MWQLAGLAEPIPVVTAFTLSLDTPENMLASARRNANEGWCADDYDALALRILELGVALVEQPLPAGSDDAPEGRARALLVCADEACHDRDSLASLEGNTMLSTSSWIKRMD